MVSPRRTSVSSKHLQGLAPLLVVCCGLLVLGQPEPARRVSDIHDSVWVEFSKAAKANRALNLGQGFPDFGAPQRLVEELHKATNGSAATALNHQYASPTGHSELVQALARYYKTERNFSQLDEQQAAKHILVTVGATEALHDAIMAFVNPGDEVLIVDPSYDAYAQMVELAGGIPVFVPLHYNSHISCNMSSNLTSSLFGNHKDDNDHKEHKEQDKNSIVCSQQFELRERALKARITSNTRAMVLNTPHNPIGKVFTADELALVARLAVENNLLLLSDEVYEHLYYGTQPHSSIALALAEMWPRTITVGSIGKTFSVTGWKVGWALGPPELIVHLQRVHQRTVNSVATPLQVASARMLVAAMDGPQSEPQTGGYWASLRAELELKRDRLAGILYRAGMGPVIPEGGYFMLANFTRFAASHHWAAKEPTPTPGPEASPLRQTHQGQWRSEVGKVNVTDFQQPADFDFVRWLSREKRVQTIPASAFYSAGPHKRQFGAQFVRFCFIKQHTTLDKLEQIFATGR